MISTQESPPDAAKKQRSRVSFDIDKDDEMINVKKQNGGDEAGAASSDPDAPNNIVMQFEGAKFRGTVVPVRNAPTFQVVSDVQDAVKAYANSSCMIRDYWNAAYCTNINLGILLFESLDADTEDRTV